MPRKKSICKTVPIDQPVTKRRSIVFKIIVISIFLCFGVFLIVWNSKQINLEGSWTATKIVIDGDDILAPDPIAKNFTIANHPTI